MTRGGLGYAGPYGADSAEPTTRRNPWTSGQAKRPTHRRTAISGNLESRPPASSDAIALRRHGNRQLNSALHKIAIVQGRCDPRARAYLERKQAAGKSRLETIRALKRHLARVVFRLLRGDPGERPRSIKVRGGKVRAPALA